MFDIEKSFVWKTSLLVDGCQVSPETTFPTTMASKKIHLYSHSEHKISQTLPDDLLLPGSIISRLRYQSNAPNVLEGNIENGYQVRNTITNEFLPVNLVTQPSFAGLKARNIPISTTCSYLGTDLLGITPSNYCFYFQNNKQCKFCEILPTFKQEVEFPKTFKNLEIIEDSILTALSSDPQIKHIAITTGNIHSYDATFDYFIQVGQRLQNAPAFTKVSDVLATLMPPKDLTKIAQLKESGFNKIYFPLEVFEKNHFEIVCPGKADFGYENILEALEYAVDVFGKGNVYTNYVYGIQSLNSNLDASSYEPRKENDLCIVAVEELIKRHVIPAFTLYHFGGYNSIGKITLSEDHVHDFFRNWGQIVAESELVPEQKDSVIFSPLSLSNTLYNDGFRLAKLKEKLWT